MPDDTLAIQQEDTFNRVDPPELRINDDEMKADGLELLSTQEASQSTLLGGILGHVNFDGDSADNTTLEAIASADHRNLFRREVYVGIKDPDQNMEFLGRIVEGPFKIYFACEDGWWSTFFFYLPGFKIAD